MTISGNCERFQYFNFETNFLEKANRFQKTGVPDSSFLVKSTKIDNATFTYETALSDTNVKTNRIGNPKWTYQKEHNFTNNYFTSSKILFQFKSLV